MFSSSRRDFLKQSALLGASLPLTRLALAQDSTSGANPMRLPSSSANSEVTLNWLEGGEPNSFHGTTWGVPWPRGAFQANQTFSLQTESGQALPLQTWAVATWPDGSLKWTGHALAPGAVKGQNFRLVPGTPSPQSQPIQVQDSPGFVEVNTGIITCRIARTGDFLFERIERGGKTIAQKGALVCQCQDAPELPEAGSLKTQAFTGRTQKVTVEQNGPTRAVIKIEGKHRATNREWLPFTVRLYFYANSDAVRLLHTIIFDGDASKDFVRGLGLRFEVPLRDEAYNRHVRFVGEGKGLWAEAVQGITGLRRDPGAEVRAAQIEGKATPAIETWAASVRNNLQYVPQWGDFTLAQLNADGFSIRKRTKSGHGWIAAGAGQRAGGVGYIGGAGGGVAFGMRDFWQKHPAQLDVRSAHTDTAQVTMWLWSPDAPTMDLRPYHDGLGEDTFAKQRQALEITYEDYEPEFNTPLGVARTSEMMLWAAETTPSREALVDFAASVQKPPLLVATPAQFLKAQVFGALWSLPDRSTPAKTAIENRLDDYLRTYENQVEEHHWYGFWDYGDFMHSYDSDRHVWRYDVGGFAWDNSELSPDLWLWYSFLRSGRADVFRLAEAMTRHTSEVDVHHIGRFAGLGSRHNVQHWGDSSKQVRVSSAGYKRFYFYLTADERTGDLIRELLDSDVAAQKIDVGRKLGEGDNSGGAATQDRQSGLSFGTSWSSIVFAWLTEYERTGNTYYRDKILNGMRSIGAMPRGWLAGQASYDNKTGIFTNNSNTISMSHLNAVFGAVEVNAELFQLFDVPEYRAAWLQYCRLYNAPDEEQKREVGQSLGKLNLRDAHSRLTAFAAAQNKDPKLAARAWSEFLGRRPLAPTLAMTKLEGPQVLNPLDEPTEGISTNFVSQWGLAAIQNLALIGDYLPPQQ